MQGRKVPHTTTGLRQARPISLHGSLFAEPRKSLMKDLCGSWVRRHHYPIVHPLPFPASSDNSGTAQVGQMPGYLGLRLTKNLDKIADADFLISHEIQEPQPCIVAESLKEALQAEIPALDLHANNYICIDEYV